jgi:predicted RNA binding protein YcfA (HicA-like mRNA interferase family)
VTQARLVPYRRLRRVVEAIGFRWVRREGSHNIFQNSGGRIVVIPDHGAREIGRGLLGKILKQAGLSVDEYHRLLDDL